MVIKGMQTHPCKFGEENTAKGRSLQVRARRWGLCVWRRGHAETTNCHTPRTALIHSPQKQHKTQNAWSHPQMTSSFPPGLFMGL